MSHPLAELLRRFAVHWLSCADPEAARTIFADDYVMEIGGFVARGREEAYLPASTGQLARFPGLLVTVHDVVLAPDRAALRFTEHGPSAREGEGAAAWRGVSLFAWGGGRLTHNVTEEDYAGRRRQLRSGIADPVEGPAVAPWSGVPAEPGPGIEDAVRRALASGVPPDLSADDAWLGHPTPPLLDVEHVEVRDLFAAGDRAGFAVTEHGSYRGGLDVPGDLVGRRASLGSVGLVSVDGPAVTGHVVRDRSGLRRALLDGSSRAATG